MSQQETHCQHEYHPFLTLLKILGMSVEKCRKCKAVKISYINDPDKKDSEIEPN
ncbi:MAG: hypothetical protein Fur0024_5240 [Patescibacteria group bacterium]